MKFSKYIKPILPVILLITNMACSTINAAYNYGYYYDAVQDKFVLITKDPDDFGVKRISNLMDLSYAIKGFVQSHGLPDMMYEFEIGKRSGINLYYINLNQVYTFIDLEENFAPHTRYLENHRPIRPEELSFYNEAINMLEAEG